MEEFSISNYKDVGKTWPIDHIETGKPWIVIVLGLSSSLILYFILQQEILIRGTEGIMLAIIVGFFDALLMLFMFLLLSYQRQIRIDDSGVHYSSKSFFLGKKSWQEPISAFQGVIAWEASFNVTGQHRARRGNFLLIKLIHRENHERDLVLLRDQDASTQRSRLEQFAKVLKLPILKRVESGDLVIDRRPEELDLSVTERIRAGMIEVNPHPLLHAPGSIEVKSEHDSLLVRVPLSRGITMSSSLVNTAVVALSLGGIFSYLYAASEITPVFIVLASVVLFLSIISSEVFSISSDALVHEIIWGRSRIYSKRIPLAIVEEIEVSVLPGAYSLLEISGDGFKRYMGYSMTKEQQQWLRSLILSKVTESN